MPAGHVSREPLCNLTRARRARSSGKTRESQWGVTIHPSPQIPSSRPRGRYTRRQPQGDDRGDLGCNLGGIKLPRASSPRGDYVLHLTSIFVRPLLRVFLVGKFGVKLDMPPKLIFCLGRERSGAGFHAEEVCTAIGVCHCHLLPFRKERIVHICSLMNGPPCVSAGEEPFGPPVVSAILTREAAKQVLGGNVLGSPAACSGSAAGFCLGTG